MATNEVKLSNVIGAPFTDYVLRQLANRAYRSSTGTAAFGTRTNEEVLYLANKSAWVRLVSSVDIILPPDDPSSNTTSINAFVNKLGIEGSGTFTSTAASNYTTSNSLAKNWILQAGTSLQNGNGVDLRRGLGPNGAYGLGGTQELGYRPMPGLTSVTVETTGRLGSLRQATINFKVWNMNQLNTVEALYFRLGYSMLLEWGHTQYYKNEDAKNVTVPGGTFTSKEIYGIPDPFDSNLWVEDIQRRIAIKREETSGNYDGMLGVVTNFTWSFNQQGGYDCVVRIVGLGSVMDSMRVNQVYKLPEGLLKQYKGAEAAFDAFVAQQIALLKKQVDDLQRSGGAGGTGVAPIDPKPSNKAELRAREEKYDDFPTTSTDAQYLTAYGVASARNLLSNQNYWDYFGTFAGRTQPLTLVNKAQAEYGGLWLANRPQGFVLVKPGAPVNLDLKVLSTFASSIDGFDWKDPGGTRTRTSLSNVSYVKELKTETPSIISDLFSYATGYYSATSTVSTGVAGASVPNRTSDIFVKPDSPVPTETSSAVTAINGGSSFNYQINVGFQGGAVTRDINFKASWTGFPPGDRDFPTTRRQFVEAVANWDGKNAIVTSIDFTKNTTFRATIKGTFQINVKSYYAGTSLTDALKAQLKAADPSIKEDANGRLYKNYLATIDFETNNPGFIEGLATPPPPPPTPGGGTAVNAGNSPGTPAKVNSDQTDSSLGFASALHAMLTIIQVTSQEEAIKAKNPKDPYKNRIVVVNTRTAANTATFYKDGIFKDVLGNKVAIDPQNPVFNLTAFAQKGFATELMANYNKFINIPYIGGTTDPTNTKVGFNDILKSVVIKYKQNNLDGVTYYPSQFPVYISLGYLLAFLNNICLFYNSKTDPSNPNQTGGNDNRPYVYIDFNPETNFCLTSPQQFSIDPLTCLISAELDLDQYLNLFPKDIKPTDPFDPVNKNSVTKVLKDNGFGFKDDDPYRGRTMNIMLSTQYLLRTLRDFTTSNPDHAVNLQPFLERIMMDVNKCLGGMNLFRVAYRDDTNTIQIQDDQFVPSLTGEPTTVNRLVFIENLKNNAIQSGQLPIFGTVVAGPNNTSVSIPSLGIAREMQFKSVMSTKMASMIAISAQAYTGSINAKDHSELSYLNRNYRDRFKPFVKDQTNGTGGSNTNAVPATGTSTTAKTSNISNDQQAANRFNEHVKSIYTTLELVAEKIDPSRNYYIERISKVKSGDIITSAAPFIPAELELTLDGISGIVMGNAFTIPKERLPLSLKNEIGPGDPDGFPKVGFIVSGLSHTIESNQWLTRIKGQMIKLREQSTIGTTVAGLNPVQSGVAPLASSTTTAATGGGGGSLNSNRNDPNSPCYVPPFVLQSGRIDTLPARGKRREGVLAWRNAFPDGRPKGLKAFLEAQTYHEGFFPAEGGKPASKSWRTNNPGNIGNTDDGTTNQLPSLTAGIERQISLLNTVISGRSSNYPADPTLYEYISIYAPPCYRPDKSNRNYYIKGTNNPISYTNSVIAYVKGEYGIDIAADMRLSEITSIT